jgi:hypothetical protein
MCVEAEYAIQTPAKDNKDYKLRTADNEKFVAPAQIEKVMDGKLLVKLVEPPSEIEPFWVETTSDSIHPCGWWNYVIEKILKPTGLNSHRGVTEFRAPKNTTSPNTDSPDTASKDKSHFDWAFFFNKKEMQSALPVAFGLFTDRQTDGMSFGFYPDPAHLNRSQQCENLTCTLIYNPRFIWSNLRKLSDNDITSIYRETGIIAFRDDAKKQFKLAPSALVLLPKQIDPSFVAYPNVNFIRNLSNLNVTCTHREEIKILVGDAGYFMSINYPHLIHADCLDLVEQHLKLEMNYLIDIFVTCYDLGNSLVNQK